MHLRFKLIAGTSIMAVFFVCYFLLQHFPFFRVWEVPTTKNSAAATAAIAVDRRFFPVCEYSLLVVMLSFPNRLSTIPPSRPRAPHDLHGNCGRTHFCPARRI